MFYYLGSSMLIVLIAFIIVDILFNKKMSMNALLGRLMCIVILFLILART